LGSKCRKGGKGCWEPRGGQVVCGEGAGDPKGCQASSVSAVGSDGGRHASRDKMEVGVEKKALGVHGWTLCQKLFMPRRVL